LWKREKRRRSWWKTVLLAVAGTAAALYGLAVFLLVTMRWVNPPVTMVQIQRRAEAWIHHTPYHRRSQAVPLSAISPNLQHAVIAAEDGRFYQHHGIDWKEVQKVVDKDLDEGHLGRGGSTITQQLVKNLFFTTHRSILRKVVEFTLAPTAEFLLPKNRILDLYLNVVEWGPGVYGAEAASRYWYNVPASRLNREQAARLAALLPAPLRRKPGRMNGYSSDILNRMAQTGW
jgi:monofunctional glycosyltransferase